jgi:quercetin dioxygenase-like cupin family protein
MNSPRLDATARGIDFALLAIMSSLNRPLDGDTLVRHLTQDERTIDRELLAKHGRSARTLVKEGPLRLTLVALAGGGVMPKHSAEGPVTIHLVEGEVTVNAAGAQYPLKLGDVLMIAAGVEHDVTSARGGVFLLTVVFLGRENGPNGGVTSNAVD